MAYAQQLSFDYFIDTENVFKRRGLGTDLRNYYHFLNAETGETMSVAKISGGYLATIYDNQRKKLHYFRIYRSGDIFRNVYDASVEYDKEVNPKAFLNNVSQSNISAVDGRMSLLTETGPLQYEIKVFRKPESRKPSSIIKIELQPSAVTWIHMPGLDVRDPMEQEILQHELQKKGCCFMVKHSAVQWTKSKSSSNQSVKEFLKTSLTLTFPDNLKMMKL
ncbi:hypothetical protein [Chryseobacterium sp. MFBS3-17]|uniref:hypothetical protein n=1 Tax=Chryseobacterium sp. MFBS3-17 TaxID=2886689 RepID=UPI001D0F46A9|nr:hypothetical protein [Chryseobacterium sp. MFBS3-17]MCC2590001.1 hypothetical protein [Chryseobacterium sp. MFBS3-17]